MLTSDFDYCLPSDLIAQTPASPRDHSRLMIVNRQTETIEHHYFYELPELLSPQDVLVFNKTKVIPARLFAHIENKPIELLLVKKISENGWQVMAKPAKKLEVNTVIDFKTKINPAINLMATVVKVLDNGQRIIEFNQSGKALSQILENLGSPPLPPYIKNSVVDPSTYQTIFAEEEGAIAAPTAGLHFMEKTFQDLKRKNIQTEFVTLHVGVGTFQPVKTVQIEDHMMHHEDFELTKDTAEKLQKAKSDGRRIIAVGTTVTRVLEHCTKNGQIKEQTGETDIFIYPGYQFRFVDALLTNFHLPKSTLLMLISALAGREFMLKAYAEAIRQKYRFYSFGDAMLIL